MAEERIKDAKALIDGGRWEFAYYTVGYTVECALKSCVLARMIHTDWVFDEQVKRVDDCRTHDFTKLIYGDLTMSTITRPSGTPPFGGCPPPPSPAAPTETTTVPDEERGVMRDVSWEFYDRLSDAIGEQSHIRMAYDGKNMEIMTLGPKHERSKEWLGEFIREVALGLKIAFEPMGSTTWKRFKEKSGVESDLCYYFDQAKLQAVDENVESNDVDDYPNPDLAVEVDISPSKIDRPKIYASLKVSEIWRFKKKAIVIEQLGPNGVYLAATSSRFLHVRPDEVTRWLAGRKFRRPGDWTPRLREWIQTELKARVDAKDARPRPTRRRKP